jgi:hypothetical protein|tara:strand:- start:343 stop:519 length:177 start_codon:yes stop_codon:yes gene_type:complete
MIQPMMIQNNVDRINGKKLRNSAVPLEVPAMDMVVVVSPHVGVSRICIPAEDRVVRPK